ncbi:hypothetical protein FRC20_003305 [Serendipita sp. 405]|nr:hypothetical protein FRC15_003721 [Serendipita sp. 397]KAG8777442.1 hypothetical protein FRC16_004154 [Serendipita sp. 398]KAG8824810.1 hypothetical protein FRC18_010439 [Serendipita sp. 400]KAG8845085.1 hypothetical protein FRC20_003305 [Serendipita sp. 405]
MGNSQSSPQPTNSPSLIESTVTSLNQVSIRQQKLPIIYEAPTQTVAKKIMQDIWAQVTNSCTVITGSISMIEDTHQFAMAGCDVAKELLEGTLNDQALDKEISVLIAKASVTYTTLKSFKDNLCVLRASLNKLHVDSKETIEFLERASRISFFRRWLESRAKREERETIQRDYDLVSEGEQIMEAFREFLNHVIKWINDAQSNTNYIKSNLQEYQRGDNMRANGMAAKFKILCDELPKYQAAVEECRDKCPQ